MSKGIGWDIGIKNLAYCVLEQGIETTSINTIEYNNNKYNIINWNDISLVSQIESNMEDTGEVSYINNTLKCSAINETATKKANKKENKNKKLVTESDDQLLPDTQLCGKTAMYCKEETYIDESGAIKYYGLCKTHFKKCEEERLPELNVKKCWKEECTTKPIKVLKTHIYKGFCKKHINDMLKAKTQCSNAGDFLKINRAKTTSKFDINQLGNALFQELDKIKTTILDASNILLENQPVLKNPTMKSMQMFLYSYYLLRILDSNSNTDTDTDTSSGADTLLNNKKIQCYCASKKLDLITFLPEEEQKKITEMIEKVNSGYQKNKKMAVMIVELLLKKNTKWLAFFKSNTKQDDLADSLLMTLHYFEKINLSKQKTDILKIEKKKEKKELKDKKELKELKEKVIL